MQGDTHNQGLLDTSQKENSISWGEGKLSTKALSHGSIIIPGTTIEKILNNQHITYACWIYINADEGDTNDGVIFGNQSVVENNNRKFSLFLYPSVNTLHYSWMNDSKNLYMYDAFPGVLPSYKWTHITVTYENPIANFYINGELIGSKSWVSNSSSFNYDTSLCNIHNSKFYLQDIRLYNHCLSSREVRELYNTPIVHFPLNQIDKSKNLISNTSITPENIKLWTNNNTSAEIVKEDNYTCVHITTLNSSASLNRRGFYYNKKTCTVYADKTYTYSFWIKSKTDVDFDFGRVGHYQVFYENADHTVSGSNFDTNRIYSTNKLTANKWTHCKIQFTTMSESKSKVNSYYFFPYIYYLEYGEEYWIRNLKIEEGTVTTPWTPSWDDSDSWFDTIEYDTSGYCNNGIVEKATSPQSVSQSNNYEYPRYTRQYYFSAKSFIKFKNPLSGLEIPELTINTWVMPCKGCGDYSTIFSKYIVVNSDKVLWLCVNTEGSSVWAYINANSPQYCKKKYASLSLNTWYMVTFVFDNGTAYWYLNGELLSSTKTDFTYKTIVMPEYFAIGNSYTNTHWKTDFVGYMSDFRLYSHVLNDNDVIRLYESSASITNTGTLLLSGEVIEN